MIFQFKKPTLLLAALLPMCTLADDLTQQFLDRIEQQRQTSRQRCQNDAARNPRFDLGLCMNRADAEAQLKTTNINKNARQGRIRQEQGQALMNGPLWQTITNGNQSDSDD